VPLNHPYQDQPVLRVVFEGNAAADDQPSLITASEVTPEYFRLLGMTLVRGRLLDEFDDEKNPSVAVVSESMARTYWPDADALGKRLKLSRRDTSWTTVVGIVADARTESLASAGVPQLYTSLYRKQGKHLAIFLRGHMDTGLITHAVRDEVQSINSALPVFGAEPLSETVSGSLAIQRFAMQLIAIFGVTALVLAALGIYGVISYMVNERVQEIGLRFALGAEGADVMRMVMREGLRLAVIGGVLGLLGAVVVSRVMSDFLVSVKFGDPLPFAAAAALLSAAALVGCYLPARRVVRVDPIVALRG
jgi:predicted permease